MRALALFALASGCASFETERARALDEARRTAAAAARCPVESVRLRCDQTWREPGIRHYGSVGVRVSDLPHWDFVLDACGATRELVATPGESFADHQEPGADPCARRIRWADIVVVY